MPCKTYINHLGADIINRCRLWVRGKIKAAWLSEETGFLGGKKEAHVMELKAESREARAAKDKLQ